MNGLRCSKVRCSCKGGASAFIFWARSHDGASSLSLIQYGCCRGFMDKGYPELTDVRATKPR